MYVHWFYLEPFFQACIHAKYLLVMLTAAIKCSQHVAVSDVFLAGHFVSSIECNRE